MRGRWPVRAAGVAAVLVALTTGCSHQDGAASPKAPGASPSAPAATGAPSGYGEMEHKLDAAESAAAAADRDATSNADR
ncbi:MULTISPECIES: hypothetical protein [unclassified Streptomyces]|uniref:hypothetical protein n=1 Tax=unclassified Streptomyces TaxID=2593676 RepID=UPI00129B651E|nr:hypothetical protein [Streptomyces sp. SUK 48]